MTPEGQRVYPPRALAEVLALLLLAPACGDDAPALDTAGSSTTADDTSSTGMETSEGSTGQTEGSSGSTTGPLPCMGNEDCPDAAAPLCDPEQGECVRCDGLADGDAACAELNAEAPLCVEGACVQCTAEAPEACQGMTPVCDEASNACVPCAEHDQCGDAACNLFTGACLPNEDGAVVHVGAGQDFATLGGAVASFDAMTGGTIIVHAGVSYDEAVTVDGGRVVAFVAAELGVGIEPPRWIRSAGMSPQLVVTEGTVLMDGIQVSGNASTMDPGVRVDGGRAWLDRSRVIGNDGGGIVAEGGGELVLRNCFVGGDVSNTDVVVIDSSDSSILYTSILGGDGNLGLHSTALTCTAPLSVEVRNSVLVTIDDGTPEVACADADVSFSASETSIDGVGNEVLGDIQAGWFVDVANDLHLGPMAPITIATTARWAEGDPFFDIDGESRPGVDGVPDVAGADVP